MSDLFISPFHVAYRKPDVVSPVTPSQANMKELPYIDWQKQSKEYKIESITYSYQGELILTSSNVLEILI